jgi:fatty-acyl-CoA synthase
LAEATLVVSFGPPDIPPVVDRVSRDGIAKHVAVPVPDADHDQISNDIVCVGLPVDGMEVRIERAGVPCRPREIGAVEIRGPAVASHYLTEDGSVAIADADGWFGTGDLGYLDESRHLYVCGRSKDIIIIGGRNLYPNDIERAAASVEGVRSGCVIAVRIDAGIEREGFAVLAEVHQLDDEDERARLSQEITARVHSQIGHTPREVRLFCAGALPKTPSGKPRRSDARELLRN